MPTSDHEQQVLQLFVRHQPRIRGFITSLLPDYDAAEDVLQETFLVVKRKAGVFDLGTNFLPWAFQIARFQVMKAGQKHRAAGRFSNEALDLLAADAPVEPLDEPRLAALASCLGKLSPQPRRIVDLFYEQELRPREIASIIGWTPGSVSVALSRARCLLRECIEQRVQPKPV